MKPIRSMTTFALVLLSVAACNRGAAVPASPPRFTLDRACSVAIAADARRDSEISKLQRDLSERRASARAAEQLGYRFIALARLSNDPGYYTMAEQAAACVASIAPGEPAALLLRGHALHQMHRFGEAEAIARQLVKTREFVLDFGLLGDSLMEQGKVAEAAEAYQKMIDLKPFYQSYTRASHLRWLTGDLSGAIRMMHRAVESASPRDREAVAWAYSRLAIYELQRGRLTEALRMTDASLQYVPDYAAALLARGRIQLAQNQNASAVESLKHAATLNPLPEYQWAFADALRLVNRTGEAASIEQQLVRDGVSEDPRTVALYLSTRREEADKAMDLAKRELERRSDVFTLDALAWSLVRAGEVREASTLIDRALAEGTDDGRLFLHAAVIAAADGRPRDAARWERKARRHRFTLLPSELGVLRTGIVLPPLHEVSR
jgi:tetratricopeptide (TPR) repeat protein